MFVVEINCAVICRFGSVVNISPYDRRLQERPIEAPLSDHVSDLD